MKKKNKIKRKKPFIVIKIKFKIMRIVSEICIATLIIGNMEALEIKAYSPSYFCKYKDELLNQEVITGSQSSCSFSSSLFTFELVAITKLKLTTNQLFN